MPPKLLGTQQPESAGDVKASERNKFLPLHKQEVRDERGRKRLHGAFTGGFSAGYFNTVGSKEGWQPTQFVSSRADRHKHQQQKHQQQQQQHVLNSNPRDFMDEEDLADAKQAIELNEDFTSFGGTERELSKRAKLAETLLQEDSSSSTTAAASTSAGKVDGLLSVLLGPPKDSVGVRLMKLMGWREGQGIGPKRRMISRRSTNLTEQHDENEQINDDDVDGDDFYPKEFLFAPKDAHQNDLPSIKAKRDVFGVGYDPYRHAPEFKNKKRKIPGREELENNEDDGDQDDYDLQLAIKREKEAAKKAKSFMGASGGFGVGVFEEEDEDEDVYGGGNSSNIIFHDDEGDEAEFNSKKKSTSRFYSSSAFDDNDDDSSSVPQSTRWNNNSILGPDGLPPLPGFHYATKPEFAMEIHVGPVVPDDWKPRPVLLRRLQLHSADQINSTLTHHSTAFSSNNTYQLDPDKRRDILGEEKLKAPERSVFSFIPSKAQDQIKELMDRTSFVRSQQKSSSSNDQQQQQHAPQSTLAGLADVEMSKDTALQALQGFIPFESDPAKQARYRNFLRVKAGLENDLMKPPPYMKPTELAHEAREFSKAGEMYKPLNSMMASRFTSSSLSSAASTSCRDTGDGNSSKTVERVYGKLTRRIEEWVPCRLLCKRFNVANPFPDRIDLSDSSSSSLTHSTPTSRLDPKQALSSMDVLNQKTMDGIMQGVGRAPFEHKIAAASAHSSIHGGTGGGGVGGVNNSSSSDLLDNNTAADATQGGVKNVGEEVEEGDALEGTKKMDRPAMDLFKSIFADDSEDEDEDNDEEDKGVKDDRGLGKIVPSDFVNDNAVPPSLPNLAAATFTQDQRHWPASSTNPAPPQTKPLNSSSVLDSKESLLNPSVFKPVFTKRSDRGAGKKASSSKSSSTVTKSFMDEDGETNKETVDQANVFLSSIVLDAIPENEPLIDLSPPAPPLPPTQSITVTPATSSASSLQLVTSVFPSKAVVIPHSLGPSASSAVSSLSSSSSDSETSSSSSVSIDRNKSTSSKRKKKASSSSSKSKKSKKLKKPYSDDKRKKTKKEKKSRKEKSKSKKKKSRTNSSGHEKDLVEKMVAEEFILDM